MTRKESLATSYAASGLQWPHLTNGHQSYGVLNAESCILNARKAYPFWFNARREKFTMMKDEGFFKDDTAASRNSLHVPGQHRVRQLARRDANID
jgi:hypothetical protein